MKKLILLLFLSTSLCSQNYVISVNRVLPDTVCTWDTIRVNFTYTVVPGPYSGTTFKITGINQQATGWQGSYTTFTALPSENYQGKQNKILKLIMPEFYYAGPVFIECDGDMKYTQYKHCAQQPTGLQENTIAPITPIYYDLYGNRMIAPTSNEIIIEQRGNVRRKIIIL